MPRTVELGNRFNDSLAVLLHLGNPEQDGAHQLLVHASSPLEDPELLHDDWNIDEVFVKCFY